MYGNGGGIDNSGTLTVTNWTITNTYSNNSGGAAKLDNGKSTSTVGRTPSPVSRSLPALSLPPGAHIVGMASTTDGTGAWLTDQFGDVYADGSAQYKGGLGGVHSNTPVVGIAAAASGQHPRRLRRRRLRPRDPGLLRLSARLARARPVSGGTHRGHPARTRKRMRQDSHGNLMEPVFIRSYGPSDQCRECGGTGRC
jgi:hypothetical protein